MTIAAALASTITISNPFQVFGRLKSSWKLTPLPRGVINTAIGYRTRPPMSTSLARMLSAPFLAQSSQDIHCSVLASFLLGERPSTSSGTTTGVTSQPLDYCLLSVNKRQMSSPGFLLYNNEYCFLSITTNTASNILDSRTPNPNPSSLHPFTAAKAIGLHLHPFPPIVSPHPFLSNSTPSAHPSLCVCQSTQYPHIRPSQQKRSTCAFQSKFSGLP